MSDTAERVWLTCGSPTTPGVVNPLTAACQQGFVPSRVTALSNEGVRADVDRALAICETVVEAYGGEATVDTRDLDDETDFAGIVDYYRSSIEAAREAGAAVAVDVTPGRKFMSAIAFQAGMQFEAEHVFYFYRDGAYRGFFPEIPRTAYELIDFREEL